MFIDVTRLHGERPLRVAIAAIAYMDDAEGGTVLHLVGGQRLLSSDSKEDLERACLPQIAVAELASGSWLSADDADMLANKIADAIAGRLQEAEKPLSDAARVTRTRKS